jgi:Fusaric acid resistance protein-like
VSSHPGMVWPGLVTRQQVFLAGKAAIAAGLAWVAALAAHPHSLPFFAPLAALLVVQPTVYDSLSRAFQRVAGVVVGVAAALTVSHFLALSAWSIGIIVFAGLLLGWAARLGPQGAVQVPVSALLVFLVGRATPGYGGERIADTLIGAGVAVIAVLLSPSAPGPDAVMSRALTPLRRCTEILRAVSAGIGSSWTPGQAASWRLDAIALVDAVAAARREHQGDRLSTRWNARARRDRAVLGRAEEALLSAERIAIYTRSMARALADGSGDARPMPTLSAMLAKTASATEAYTAWVGSAGTPADRRLLAAAVHAADDILASALTRVQERWRNDPGQWLTFGMTLAMSQRILAEVGRPLDPAEREPA